MALLPVPALLGAVVLGPLAWLIIIVLILLALGGGGLGYSRGRYGYWS